MPKDMPSGSRSSSLTLKDNLRRAARSRLLNYCDLPINKL
jgi:hypothetical protein